MLLLFYMVVAFFIGSIPFGYLIVKKVKNEDIRKFGSGNIGATNVARVLGLRWAFLTFLFDGFKGFFAIMLAKYLMYNSPNYYFYLIGFACVLGHSFTPILNFKGGKGIATTIIMLFALKPVLAITMIVSWGICFKTTKISALSALASILITNLMSWFVNDFKSNLVLFCLTLFIFYTHRENIKRLLENKEFGFKK